MRTKRIGTGCERGYKRVIIIPKASKQVNREFREGDNFTSNGKGIYKHFGFVKISGDRLSTLLQCGKLVLRLNDISSGLRCKKLL